MSSQLPASNFKNPNTVITISYTCLIAPNNAQKLMDDEGFALLILDYSVIVKIPTSSEVDAS